MVTALIGGGGLVVVLLLVLSIRHMRRCSRDRLRCAEKLPSFAEELGIEYRPPRKLSHQMGTLTGEYRGREINLTMTSGDPLEIGTRSGARFPAEFKMEKSHFRPDNGLVVFETGEPLVDKFFKTRHASVEFAETIRSTPELTDALASFVRRWARKIEFLKISRGWARGGLKIAKILWSEGEETWQDLDDLRIFIPEIIDLLDLLQQYADRSGDDAGGP